MNGDFTAAAWAFLKSLRHRETMTVVVETPAQTPTDAGPDGPLAGRRRIALGAIIALAGGCSLVLLNAIVLGPAWVHGPRRWWRSPPRSLCSWWVSSVGSRPSLPPRPPVL